MLRPGPRVKENKPSQLQSAKRRWTRMHRLSARGVILVSLVAVLSSCGGTGGGGGVNGDLVYYSDVTPVSTGSSSGSCNFTTILHLDTSNSTGFVHAPIQCVFGQMSPEDQASIAQGVRCKAQATATFLGPPQESFVNQTQGFAAFTTCYVYGQTHPKTTFNCPTSGCKGDWDASSVFTIEFPPQFRFGLASKSCQVYGTQFGLSNGLNCTYSFSVQTVT
jgi:hypothetical protein